MAQVQIPRRQVRIASQSPGKENIPPTWATCTPPRKNHHHHKSRRNRHDHNATAREVLAPLPAGVLKSAPVIKEGFFQQFGRDIQRTNSDDDPLRVRPGFFAKYRQDEEQEESLDMGFSGEDRPNKQRTSRIFCLADTLHHKPDAAHTYCHAAATYLSHRQSRRNEALTARTHGLDINGNPILRPPRHSAVPTEADFDAIFAELRDLDRDMADATIPVKFPKPDGTVLVKEIRLGDSLSTLTTRKARKIEQNKDLEAEIAAVKIEMEGLRKQIEGEDEETRKVEGEFEEEMRALRREEEEVKKEAKRKMREVKREEDEVTERFNRKVEELFLLAGGGRG